MPRLSSKYNDSCIKMFEFLKLLTQGPVDFKDVIEIFSDEKTAGKSNPHVTLNKYLNTLKVLGLKIKKKQNKYYLLNFPYKISLDTNDIKSLSLIKQASELLPKGKTKKNIDSIIKSIEIRLSESTQAIEKTMSTTENIDYSFIHDEIKDQIKRCEHYCQEHQKLEILYTTIKGEQETIKCSPIEIKYEKRKVCLTVNVQSQSKIVDIPLEQILKIKQLPNATTQQIVSTTIVYKLKNRLAKNYKLRAWERSDGLDSNGNLIVINKNEDQDQLLARLMRYGEECTIESPKFFKEKMLELINQTLENYKN